TAIQPNALTPVTVQDVLPGDYLVVAEVKNHGFHEVYRRVPAPGELLSTIKMFPHAMFEQRDDRTIALPAINVPKAPVCKEMAFLPGGEFTMGTPDFGPALAPAHQRTVLPFYLDKTEVTVSAYRAALKSIPDRLRVLSPAGNEPVRFVKFDEAV